jgi:hypothetical protein
MINKLIISFIFCVSLLGSGCSFLIAKAGSDQADNRNFSIESKTEVPAQSLPAADEKPVINAASVVGTYQYETEKDGEGYDNSLEVTDAGAGKLYISLLGSYIYKIGETQSMHEAEGKGEAILQGTKANATLVDEAGKPCRATITFAAQRAEVKIPETCQFNVALDGVYQKISAKNQTVKTKPEIQPAATNEVKYSEVMDFINDFETRKAGEEFIITEVPPAILDRKDRADEFGNKSYKDLFYLQGVTDDDSVSYSVLTSKAMIESLNQNAEYEPVTLQMSAVIVESKGKFDVYRIPFITRIEGLNNDGSILWTASGEKPAKTKFTH